MGKLIHGTTIMNVPRWMGVVIVGFTAVFQIHCGSSASTEEGTVLPKLSSFAITLNGQLAAIRVEVCHQGKDSDPSRPTILGLFYSETNVPTCDALPDQEMRVPSLSPGDCTEITSTSTVPWGKHTAWIRMEDTCTDNTETVVPQTHRWFAYRAVPGENEADLYPQIQLEQVISALYTAILNNQLSSKAQHSVRIHTIADIFEKTTQQTRSDIHQLLVDSPGILLLTTEYPQLYVPDGAQPMPTLAVELDENPTKISVEQALQVDSIPLRGSLYLDFPSGFSVLLAMYRADNGFDCEKIQLKQADDSEIYIIKKSICLYNQYKDANYEQAIEEFLNSSDVTNLSVISGFTLVDDQLTIQPVDPRFDEMFDLDLAQEDWSQRVSSLGSNETDAKLLYSEGLTRHRDRFTDAAL